MRDVIRDEEDEEEVGIDTDFDITPVKKTCKFCQVEVTTYVEQETHPLFFISALFIFMVFGFLGLVIVPVVFLLTKSAVHRCSRCLQKMGEKQCFGLPTDPADEVWHFRLGKCSVVLSRLYAILILVVFCVIAGYYVYLHPNEDPHHHPLGSGKQIEATWSDYIEDCGAEVVVENFVHAKKQFEDKYQSNIITWRGYFAQTKATSNQISLFYSDHALNILVKMSPTESSTYPDLVLSISSTFYS